MKTNILICFLFTLKGAFAVYADEPGTGELILENTLGERIQAPQLAMDVDIKISGIVASVTINQTFINTSDQWQHAKYVFPLPDNAAVDGATLKVGDRIMRSEIQEKKKAKQTFIKASNEGKKAALLSTDPSNLFTSRIANIGPGEEVSSSLHYVQTLDYIDGQYQLRLPMTYTPKAGPQSCELPCQAKHVERSPLLFEFEDLMPRSDRAVASQFDRFADIQVELDAGINLTTLKSEFHHPYIEENDNGRYRVSASDLQMNKDFVLQWQPDIQDEPIPVAHQQMLNGEYFGSVVLYPPKATDEGVTSRQLTFVIDTSGSMNGKPLEQAKISLLQGLQTLTPNDQFQIIRFSSHAFPLFSQPVFATSAHVNHAATMIRSLSSGGGTNMRSALELALYRPAEQGLLSQIIFVTDGAVSDEADLFNYIASHLGNHRLFTVGIGAAPNIHFMEGAASHGKGTYTYISHEKDINHKMDALFASIHYPQMTDVQVLLDGIETADFWPNPIPDLYQGRPVVVSFRSDEPISNIDIMGKIGASHYAQSLAVDTSEQDTSLDTLWANSKIRSHQQQMVLAADPEFHKKVITQVALAHSIVTPYTSLVAVEEQISRLPGTPVNLGALKHRSAAKRWLPQTATIAPVHFWKGMALMLLISFLLIIHNRLTRGGQHDPSVNA